MDIEGYTPISQKINTTDKESECLDPGINIQIPPERHLFRLAVAVSFDFFFTRTHLAGLAGCFSSMCHFRFAVDVTDVQSCIMKPGGQSLHKKLRFSPPGSSLTFL